MNRVSSRLENFMELFIFKTLVACLNFVIKRHKDYAMSKSACLD